MTELVILKSRQVVTASTTVAESFEKEHKNVLRDISNLKKDVLNFEQMFHEGVEPDSYGRSRKVFYMNRDGFTLLAMGFTGKKAMKFKLKYIAAFNKMEAKLSELNQPSYMLDDPIARAERWIAEQKEIKQLKIENKENKRKADYFDRIMKSPSTVTMTQISQDYGLSAKALNKILHDEGVQFKSSGQWILYSQYKNKGYVDSDTFEFAHRDGRLDVNMHTKWTQKGRKFIYEVLEKRGIRPQVFMFQEEIAQ
jgi:Rha family phage regulatory protein